MVNLISGLFILRGPWLCTRNTLILMKWPYCFLHRKRQSKCVHHSQICHHPAPVGQQCHPPNFVSWTITHYYDHAMNALGFDWLLSAEGRKRYIWPPFLHHWAYTCITVVLMYLEANLAVIWTSIELSIHSAVVLVIMRQSATPLHFSLRSWIQLTRFILL